MFYPIKKIFSSRKHISVILWWGVFLSIAFCSCKNFMNANDVKAQIEESIEIANSNYTTYYVIADDKSGTVTPSQFQLKRKQTFDVMFVPAEGWSFVCWEVLDRTTGEVITDSITFDNPTQLETKGTVIKPQENLMIHPKVVQHPMILSVTPGNSKLSYANTTIYIEFNIPVEDKTTTPENSKFIYGTENINITNGLSSINELFELPEFNEEKTELRIQPDNIKLLEYMEAHNTNNIDVTISFGSNIYIQNDDNKIYLQGKTTFAAARYYNETETTPPSKNELFLTRRPVPLDNPQSISADEKFSNADLLDSDNFTFKEFSENVIRNRTNGTVYIYGKYIDEGSGVKSINIDLWTLKYEAGNYIKTEDQHKKYVVTKASENATFKTNGNTTSFCAELNIEKEIYYNITPRLIEITVSDACGNTTAVPDKYYAVVKNCIDFDEYSFYIANVDMRHGDYFDCTYDMPEGMEYQVFWENEIEDYDDTPYYVMDMDYYNKNLKNLKIFTQTFASDGSENYTEDDPYYTCGLRDELCWLNKHIQYPPELYTLQCEYIHKDGKLRTEPFSKYDSNMRGWNLDLDVDSVEGLDVKIIIKDDLGYTWEKVFTYPKQMDIVSLEDNGDGTSDLTLRMKEYYYFIMAFEDKAKGVTACWKPYSEIEAAWSVLNQDKGFVTVTINNNVDYRIMILDDHRYDGVSPACLFGELNKIYNSNMQISSVPLVELNGEPVITRGNIQERGGSMRSGLYYSIYLQADQGYMNITVNLKNKDSTGKTIYEDAFIKYNNQFYYSTDNGNSVTFEEKFNTLKAEPISYTIYGIKDNILSEGATYTINSIEETDYNAPALDINYLNSGFEYYLFKLTDEGSGPKKAEIYSDQDRTNLIYYFDTENAVNNENLSSYIENCNYVFYSGNMLRNEINSNQELFDKIISNGIYFIKPNDSTDKGTLYFFLPRWELYNKYVYMTVWDNNDVPRNVSVVLKPARSITTDHKYLFYPKEISNDGKFIMSTTTDKSGTHFTGPYSKQRFQLFNFDTNLNKWQTYFYTDNSANITNSQYHNLNITPEEETNPKTYYVAFSHYPEDSFIRINRAESDEVIVLYVPQYFYTGTEKNSGTCDFMMSGSSGLYNFAVPGGNSTNSLFISSDAPVFVHTLVTDRTEKEIQKWTRNDWELNAKPLSERQLDFTIPGLQTYTVPVNEMKQKEYYCTIAYLADGTYMMTEVKQK